MPLATILKPARSSARDTAASWVTTSAQSRPDSIIAITPASWPCARRNRLSTGRAVRRDGQQGSLPLLGDAVGHRDAQPHGAGPGWPVGGHGEIARHRQAVTRQIVPEQVTARD